jgi:hypothetical protein
LRQSRSSIQQHGEDVAGHVVVRHAAARLVRGHQHGFEQVGRSSPALGCLQAFAGLIDEASDGGVDHLDAVVECPVRGQLDELPVREDGVGAPPDGGEDLVEVALDDVAVRTQRVHLGAEGQASDGIDGEPHQVGLQVDAGLALGLSLGRA